MRKTHELVGAVGRDKLRNTKKRPLDERRKVFTRIKDDTLKGREEERMGMHSGGKEECGGQTFEERDLNV